jgi:hypothetical protein
MTTVVRDLGSWVIVLCAVLSLTFVVTYHFSALWWKSEIGKHLMAIAASEFLILATQSVRVITGVQSECFELFRLFIFLSFPVVLTWRLVILWKLQVKPKREEGHGWRRTRSSSRSTRMSRYLRRRLDKEPRTPDSAE